MSHHSPPIVRKDVATGRHLIDAVAVDVNRRSGGSGKLIRCEPASHLNCNRDVHNGTHDTQACCWRYILRQHHILERQEVDQEAVVHYRRARKRITASVAVNGLVQLHVDIGLALHLRFQKNLGDIIRGVHLNPYVSFAHFV